jgi:hypothetical protein
MIDNILSYPPCHCVSLFSSDNVALRMKTNDCWSREIISVKKIAWQLTFDDEAYFLIASLRILPHTLPLSANQYPD